MTDTVRCPACRGSKKVPKLGGMIGECNTCSGKGTILAADKPKPVEVTIEDVVSKELINAVADCVPASDIQHKATIETLPVQPDVKIDGKKAAFRHKTSAK
jgi:hypothetical protein